MYQNPTENYERHENFGIQISSDTTTTRDNNHPVPYSFANDSSYTPQFIGHNSNGQQILEQNPPTIIPPQNNPPIHSLHMNNISSSQIKTIEILGYEIILIPTSSPLASLINLDVQNQLQQFNTYSPYSVNPPQLNQEQDYTFATNGFDTTLQYLSQPPQSNASSPQIQTVEIPGYKIIIIPTSSPLANSTNLNMQHQF
ncbi:4266_t:CDS:1 [Funneliformis geosporum]|uniref:10451_t:CDS:1 n=1 Tax=Funneliformis geosporum TaxID=1117311 RepID=A0A9W4SM82_9GLOM|nr:4266_t:CDS:1 [Funneliformis geosporum]CAI2174251.1 10451_t:CDS:1 [Funneliformis geosporum]